MHNEPKITELTIEQLEHLCRKAGEQGARRVLLELGFDVNNPIEMQADANWVRKTRRLLEKSSVAAILTLTTIIITGIAALIWDHVKR